VLRILIVDDDPVSLAILQDHLAALGYDVLCANSAAGAMFALEHSAVHIVICDWVMPDISGLELCRWVRSRTLPNSPHFVILTVHSDKDRLVEAFDAGADDFLSKPFHEAELLARLRAWTRLVCLQQSLTDRNAYAEKLTSELVAANQRLADLAALDDLTGLSNRRQALRHLADLCARSARYGYPLTIASIDIDRFKSINDTYGHAAGDAVLKQVALVLAESTRSSDVVCRIAGDEFLVILPHQGLQLGMRWAERLKGALSLNKYSFRDDVIAVTVSIGLAERSSSCPDPEAMLEAADRALYSAKGAGRNVARAAV
jgi:diguanylate cyclase (GGDEF)-like protein